LVFDSADDVDTSTDKEASIMGSSRQIDYLPKGTHGFILFTTRNQKVATKLAGKNVVTVGEMDGTMAKDLLEISQTL
jgi:hypothetical protein